MSNYQTKSNVVEAFQYTDLYASLNIDELRILLEKDKSKLWVLKTIWGEVNDNVHVSTSYCLVRINKDDWLVKNSEDEIILYTSSEFESIYEKVNN